VPEGALADITVLEREKYSCSDWRPHHASIGGKSGAHLIHWPGPAYRIHTSRLVLRCWHPQDAPLLKAAIDTNLEHLRPWDVVGPVRAHRPPQEDRAPPPMPWWRLIWARILLMGSSQS